MHTLAKGHKHVLSGQTQERNCVTSGKPLELGILVPHLGIRAPVSQGERRKRKLPSPGSRQSTNVPCHCSSGVSEGFWRCCRPETLTTPLGLSFQVGARLPVSGFPDPSCHPSNCLSGEPNYLPGFSHLAQHLPFPMCELLLWPAATWPGCSLCLHTSRDGKLTTLQRQSQLLPIPWVLALCSSISPVLKQGTEGPPKEGPACHLGYRQC